MKRYTDATAAQLSNPALYAEAVLGLIGGMSAVSTRPYRGGTEDIKLPAKKDAP
jgi:hypothetical protein